MQAVKNLSTVIDKYDGLLLDLWGVIHDGSHLYPGVKEVLVELKAANKKIIMVSNAPRRATKVKKVLSELSIEPLLYLDAVSSGEMGFLWLKAGKAPWGKRYYYIGPSKDADVVDGLDYVRVDDLKQADFLLNVGFGSEEQSTQDFMPLLRAAKGAGLPMLCLNPDLEVVKQTGQRFPCAGVIGEAYERLGAKVTWFGKPYPEIYQHCLDMLKLPKQRVLGVGDSIGTDVKGALDFGMDAMLITGGILKTQTPAAIEAMCNERGIHPHYVMPQFSW